MLFDVRGSVKQAARLEDPDTVLGGPRTMRSWIAWSSGETLSLSSLTWPSPVLFWLWI